MGKGSRLVLFAPRSTPRPPDQVLSASVCDLGGDWVEPCDLRRYRLCQNCQIVLSDRRSPPVAAPNVGSQYRRTASTLSIIASVMSLRWGAAMMNAVL